MHSAKYLTSIYALILVAHLASAYDIEEWRLFKLSYDKVYLNRAEEERRMRIFFENKRRIDEHNSDPDVSFEQGVNHLSDMTSEEINSSLNGFIPVKSDQPVRYDLLLDTIMKTINQTSGSRLPSDFRPFDKHWYDGILGYNTLDWRLAGRVSKVKEQGSCGSCWAFSVTGALEGIMASRGKRILLSEQNLIDCSRDGNHGCRGGWMENGFNYVKEHGIMTDDDYPYKNRQGVCKFEEHKSVTKIGGSVMLPEGNEHLLRLALAFMGPIPIAVDSRAASFQSYKSGTYNDKSCGNRFSDVNHAVLLVGYGTDPDHGDYWIVKNSWGKKWGDNGYIRIARNRDNKCGIASYAVLPIP